MNRELKKDLFNIYDVIVFEDENGITQDCVCTIGKDKEVDEAVGVVDCNNHSISICENGSYKVWEKDGKDMPYYATNKKIIHLYTLKNDNRYYEIYPTNDYEYYISLDKAESSEALECLMALQSIRDKYSMPLTEYVNSFDYIKTIKQVLIKQQEQKKFFDDMLTFKNGCMMSCFEYKGKQIVAMPLEEYDKFMKQEKALEIIKEKPQAELSLIQLGKIKTYEEYLNYTSAWELDLYGDMVYTEEEFNLIKEVLGWAN